jgi:hypothetical protein
VAQEAISIYISAMELILPPVVHILHPALLHLLLALFRLRQSQVPLQQQLALQSSRSLATGSFKVVGLKQPMVVHCLVPHMPTMA